MSLELEVWTRYKWLPQEPKMQNIGIFWGFTGGWMELVIQTINFPAFQRNTIMAADAHLDNMTNISECNDWKEIWWWENTFGFMIEFIPNTLVQFLFEKHPLKRGEKTESPKSCLDSSTVHPDQLFRNQGSVLVNIDYIISDLVNMSFSMLLLSNKSPDFWSICWLPITIQFGFFGGLI